ncbi:MAG: glycoside hydrolase family 57 protein [Candidatus Micrarchaeota archaeon]|nr:glycoside hydrolase family 57 protein [Candidatus Micrarchaeota archaeon]
MPSICFYFQVHQPLRMRRFSIFEDNSGNPYDLYFNEKLNREVFEKVARKCYLPTNSIMLDLINKFDGRFRISYSLTGVFLDQCNEFNPKVLDSFEDLAKTGCVDFLDETYYHSLCSLFKDKREFKEQVELHRKALNSFFKYKPVVFRNTEALFTNEIAKLAEDMGYKGIVTEGFERILGWRSPDYLYRVKGCSSIKAFLRNYRLSDDVAYRFSARWWSEYPLTAEKYASWLSKCEGPLVNMFMDYETFGEHQWEDTGIFEFLKKMPEQILKYPNLNFKTPSELVGIEPVGEVDVPTPLSWADMERDASAWLGNDMQRVCFRMLEGLEPMVREAKDEQLTRIWRLLQNSDHLYYLCTKSWADGDVHKYFSPFDTPYDGFINFMNVLQEVKCRLREKLNISKRR